jgi:anti-anti-sigma factor
MLGCPHRTLLFLLLRNQGVWELSELLSIEFRQESPDTAVVVTTGEIDLSNYEALAEAISSLNGVRRIVVDLRPCTFFDSSCLGVLVRAAKKSAQEGNEFGVRVNSEGRRLMNLTGLLEKLSVEDA